MNRNQVQGKWKQLAGRARRFWNGLAEDDTRTVNAAGEQLAGAVQEKAGDVQASVNKSNS